MTTFIIECIIPALIIFVEIKNMNRFISKILVVMVLFSIVSSLVPQSAYANDFESESNTESVVLNEENINHEENNYENTSNSIGCELSDLAQYYANGQIVVNPIVIDQNTNFAYFLLNNNTNCKVNISMSSYKMYDTTLSHQEFYAGTDLVNATSSTLLKVELPGCMSQIDAWYGQFPKTLLDSNPYAYPNVPFVLAFKFNKNNGTGYHDASGDFCAKEVENTRPVITLKGPNPDVVYIGTSYIDPGATAFDKEDGDITSKIVVTGNLNTNTLGTYTLSYNVKDSKGLSATEVTRTVKVVKAPEEIKNVTLSASKVVCKAESDLPNWGNYGPDISSSTAKKYVDEHENCKIVPWTFEWVTEGEGSDNPGDQVKVAGGSWMPFNSTTSVPVGERKIWVREQFDMDYIPFSGLNTTKSISAELYCDTDVLNYDNYDFFFPTEKNKTYYCVGWNVLKDNTPVNHPPVITLVGSNPITFTVGDVFTDPGATAMDQEDGDITSKIIASSTVNVNVPGTYKITYNVKDSAGLSAEEVSRTVIVLEKAPSESGKIKFCLVLADSNNVIATSSYALPQGQFSINLGTTTGLLSSTTVIQTKNWNSNTFAPNSKAILGLNDSDCVTYDNLPFGVYTYSTLAVNGASWKSVQYNDQDTQPVNNIFDFFNYGTSTSNADGVLNLGNDRRERTVYVLAKYETASQCILPVITSPLTSSVLVNNSFSYVLTASSSSDVLTVATTTLPAWLTYATSTNTLSGTPTQTGTYNVDLKATNNCGFDAKTLVITVTSNGGGGGGSATSDLDISKTVDKATVNPGDTITYTITLVNHGPNDATNVVVNDQLPSKLNFVSSSSTLGTYATTTGVWTIGNLSNNATTTLTIVANVIADTFGQKITNTATANSAQTDPSTGNNTSSVDVNVNGGGCVSNCGGGGGGGNGGGGGGGGNGPISTIVPSNGPVVQPSTNPNSCYYLYDYLRKDFNNNPVEVKKLQVFLRDLEGFSTVQITGVYDDQTITALNAFQDRYKGDILTPWGHTAPTSYTYILTKKKVNEIYCKMMFPVTPQQQAEIDAHRNFLQGLRDNGITIPTSNPSNSNENTNGVGGSNILEEVGSNTTSSSTSGSLATLAGYSSSTYKMVDALTANVLSAGKKLLNSIASLFKGSSDETAVCKVPTFSFLNMFLILVILALTYMWYREYKNNKTIEEINKEIDLN